MLGNEVQAVGATKDVWSMSNQKKVVNVILELAGNGVFDLSSLDIDEQISHIFPWFKDPSI